MGIFAIKKKYVLNIKNFLFVEGISQSLTLKIFKNSHMNTCRIAIKEIMIISTTTNTTRLNYTRILK